MNAVILGNVAASSAYLVVIVALFLAAFILTWAATTRPRRAERIRTALDFEAWDSELSAEESAP